MNFKRAFKRTMAVLICFMLILTSFQFVATAEDRLSTNKTEYELGEDIFVTATGSGDEWVGIFNATDIPAPDCGSFYWYYVNQEGYVSGNEYVIQNTNCNLGKGSLVPGEYMVCLLGTPGEYSVVESEYITIKEPSDSRLSTNKTVYTENESIFVTAIGNGSDWVGIYEKGITPSGNPGSIYWYYVAEHNGTSFCIQEGDGGRTPTEHNYGIANGLPAGEYEIFLLLNDGYSCIEKVSITVEKVIYDNLTTDKSEYIEGDDIFVTATGVNGQKVGIYKANDDDSALPIYEYELDASTNGVAYKIQSGKLNREEVAGLPAGSYKIVLMNADGTAQTTVYITIGRKPFDEVLPDSENKEQTGENGLLKTDKIQYKMGEPIMVTATVSEQQALEKAWVGIVPAGVVPAVGGAVSSFWYYVNDTKYGAQNGIPFDIFKGNATNSEYQGYTPVTDGYYDIILFAADGYEILDKVTISRYTPEVIEKDLIIDKVTYTEGEPIYITATSPEANAWVGIYDKDTIPGPELAIHWYWVSYVNGISQDILGGIIAADKSLSAGEYKAVLFNDDGYANIEKTVYFTINPIDISNTTFDFTINGKEVESTDRIEVANGETVIVKPIVEGDGIGFSWVGIYNAQLGSDTDFTQIKSDAWKYVSEVNGQDWDITSSLKEGPNTVALFSNSGHTGIVKYVWIYVEREDVTIKTVISEATCTETGITHYVYADGTEEDVITMPLGHKMVAGTEVVEPTPDSIGGTKGKCERCDYVDFVEEVKFDISKATITLTVTAGIKVPVVSVEYKGQKLEEGKHYEVTTSETNEGKMATIVGIGNCSGIVQKPFVEAKYNLADTTITVADAMYTGKEVKPTVEVKYGDKILIEGKDYELKYSENINVGLGKVTVIGIGDFEGSVDKTFKIKSVATAPKTVKVKLSKEKFVYNGKVQKPKVTVEENGKELSSANYTVKFSNGCKKVGKYSVVVTLSGDYSGVITKTFTINPKATKITNLLKGKKSITVKWAKKTKEVSGYEIVYSLKKNFKKSVTVKINKNKTVKKVIKKLKANKKYFVKIRTVKKVGKTTFKSAWSNAKSVKTK